MLDASNNDRDQLIRDLRHSLAWMDLVMSNMGEGIMVTGSDLTVRFANDAIAQMLNQSRITLLGKPIWEALNLWHDVRLAQQDFEKALTPQGAEELSGQYSFRGEKTFAIELEVNFIPNINQAVFMVRDITHRLKNKQTLLEERIALMRTQLNRQKAEEERKLLESIINGTTSIVYLKDLDGRYELVNPEFQKTFGVSNTEVKGKTDDELFPKEIANILSRDDASARTLQHAIKREETLHFKKRTRHYLSSKYPVLSTENKPVKICGVLTDITARKKLEENKNSFIKMVYHELNTPLTVIKLFLQSTKMSIKRGKVDESLDNLTKIEDQLTQMGHLTEDLLDAARMKKAELKFQEEPFDLRALVKSAIENAQKKTEIHTIRLLGEPAPQPFRGDKQRIGQVLNNLLSNAIKYTPEGGTIKVRITSGVGSVTVSVRDTGIGISKKAQKHIFSQFNRGDMDESDYSGLGMGLFLASEIVKHHGGVMRVQSEQGQGSTFSFTLPLQEHP